MQLKTVSQLPPQAEYTFESPLKFKGKKLFVQKTGHRTVVSLNFSKFQAREVIRERKEDGKTLTFHSPRLISIIPSIVMLLNFVKSLKNLSLK